MNLDVKKIFLDTDAEVSVSGANIEADVDVNPWIIGLGVGYRF